MCFVIEIVFQLRIESLCLGYPINLVLIPEQRCPMGPIVNVSYCG